MIDLERLLRVPYVDPENGYDISFDGERVAFSWNLSGQWEIYEVNLRSARDRLPAPVSPRLVSSGPGAKSAPLYSPDGTRLVYGVDFDGSENLHILVCDLATGAQTDLTPRSKAAILPYFVWSPDSKEIAFISDISGHFCTYAMHARGRAHPRPILDELDPARAVHWSPNGRWLSVSVEARGQDYHTCIVPARGGEAHWIADENGPLNVRYAGWSADGERLAFSATRGNWYDIGIYEVEERRIAWVTQGEGDKIFPDLSPDGTCLAYILSRGALTWLAVHDLGGGTKLFKVEPGVHYAPIFTPDCRQVLLTFDNPRHPTDLWLLSLEDGKFTQLTHSLPPDLTSSDIPLPEEIWYPGLDGVPVPALLFRPSPEPGPAVVLIHGGPSWLFQMTWYPLMLHMVSRGWTVLTPGFRGSTGYGHAWQTASRFDLGGVDTRDCAAGALYLARQGLADPRRIAVTGRSHGGYLTMTCLTQFPELWVGGSAVVPFMNWFTSHEHLREDFQHWDIENMGDPNENHDHWYANSPYFFLDKLRAPVQLICAENDPRCPVEDSQETYEKLKSLGKEVDFVLYREEGHAFLKMENLVDSETRRVAFLARVLA